MTDDDIIRRSGRLLEHPIHTKIIIIRLRDNVTKNTDSDGFEYDNDLLALIYEGHYNDEDEGQFDCD